MTWRDIATIMYLLIVLPLVPFVIRDGWRQFCSCSSDRWGTFALLAVVAVLAVDGILQLTGGAQ